VDGKLKSFKVISHKGAKFLALLMPGKRAAAIRQAITTPSSKPQLAPPRLLQRE